MLKALNERLLNTFFPRKCVGCKMEGEWLCTSCTNTAAEINQDVSLFELPSGLSVVSLLRYDTPVVRELLHYLKYDSITEAASALVGIVTSSPGIKILNRLVPNESFILPVPLSRKRLRKRGYNQSEVLATSMQAFLGLPIATKCLKRSDQHSQVGQSRQQRRSKLMGVFTLSSAPQSKTIILFDDVCTTGATLEAAATPLIRAGCNVIGMTVAKV